MTAQDVANVDLTDAIAETVSRFWGFTSLRPLQSEAIDAGIAARDSLVVMPTGGGKSLCYQVPPIVTGRTDVVVSPLISLMKDQVDGLQACGYPARALHSQLTAPERRAVFDDLQSGACRLLFVSPERLVAAGFIRTLQQIGIGAFAIDEAHCISHWGHDFRLEYRQLAALKNHFPDVSVHAFTATATPRVRDDIMQQLRLDNPNVIVGRFDRPNLTYRIVPRTSAARQILQVVRRHPDEAVIIYCITRRETEEIAETLRANGINAAAYHAGLESNERRRTQERFAEEKLDVVVATVAFGMGIDRSNVRCVLHTAMPKSVEHYQQETGRAGRDGLEAECVLLYSAADFLRWKGLIERSIGENGIDHSTVEPQLELLRHLQGICSTLECRHGALSRYFGQRLESERCSACDVCLGEIRGLEHSQEIAQKILSCVARLDQRFGVGYVVQVLRGADTDQVRRFGHDKLSTHGILADVPVKTLTNLVYQLVDQDLLMRTDGDRPVLRLNEHSLALLRDERTVQLIDPSARKQRRARAETVAWEGVDRDLFDQLRALRRAIAEEQHIPVYLIFEDNTLRAMATHRPASPATFLRIPGVGQKKATDFGPRFIELIRRHCDERSVEADVNIDALEVTVVRSSRKRPNATLQQAIEMFEQGASIDAVVEATARVPRTVIDYLAGFIVTRKPPDLQPWVDDETLATVLPIVESMDTERLRPVYEHFRKQIPYWVIQLVVAFRESRRG